MRVSAVLLIFILAATAFQAFASEIADSDGGQLSPAARSLLSGYRAPRVSSVDRVARSGQCSWAWRQLRRQHVNERAPGVSVSALVAKGQRMGINPEHMKKTLAAFFANQASLPNQRYISIVDFNKRSNQKRMFIVDLRTGQITAHAVAAGLGSDPDGDGYATRFQTQRHSKGSTYASSLGCYVVAGNFNGKHGGSVMMHGIEDQNSNSCNRTVEIHQAAYVGGVPGRSNGCFAVRPGEKRSIIDRIDGGGLLCAYKDGKIQEAPIMHKSSKSSKRKGTRHVQRRRR